jgi:hypothetical protein
MTHVRRHSPGLLLFLAIALVAGCGGDDDDSSSDATASADATPTADALSSDTPDAAATPDSVGPSIDAPTGGPDAAAPVLGCDPSAVTTEALCTCMANIVCDQIYFCLSATEIASRPPDWSPHSDCVAELEEDCLDDDGDPDYLPADFPACVTDIATATCESFGKFESVSGDFPASCDNLRALDTGLGLDI